MLALRILLKDLLELAQSKALLVLVFVVPLVLVLLMGEIRVKDPVLRVAIHVGAAGEAENAGATARAEQLRQWLGEIANVSVTEWKGTADLLARAQLERIDLLADLESDWVFRTPETRPFRLQQLAALGQSIAASRERADWSGASLDRLREISAAARCKAGDGGEDGSRPGDPGEGAKPPSGDAEHARVCELAEQMRQQTQRFNSVPVPILTGSLDGEIRRYFPAVSRADRSAVPGLIALIVTFIPFLLASGAFAREREAGMLEVLVLAGRRNWVVIVAGKLLLPLLVAGIGLLLQLLLVRDAFSLGAKPGFAGMAALQMVAALASGLFGIAVAAIVRSQLQAYLASAVYLLLLILVSGYLYPLEQAGDAVRVASYAIPFTFSGPAFESWLMRGMGIELNLVAAQGLAAQCAGAAILCVAAIRRFERTL